MMKQQDIFKKIGNIIADLNEQYQFLSENPLKLNELELELFLANAHFLTDHVEIAKKLNALNVGVKNDAQSAVHQVTEDVSVVVPVMEIEVEEDIKLAAIVTAEEYEERIDVLPEQEIIDEEEIRETVAENFIELDFFKPDRDVNTFEFDLNSTIDAENEKFEFEKKPVEQIFDRTLSREEQDILAKKKDVLQDKFESQTVDQPADLSTLDEDDEVGPEPFLILNKKPEVLVNSEVVTPDPSVERYDPKYDEAVISPPVIHESPAFFPNTVPLKQHVENTSVPPLSRSFNDLLAKTNAQENEVKASIGDLKQGINLNEKLLFIKDLFNGYNLAYSEAIDLVNKLPNFETADSFLQSNYAAKNNWANKQATVDQFYELLNRRFSK